MAILVVCDKSGNLLRTLDASGIKQGETIRVDGTTGPVTFIVDSLDSIRTEHSSPFYFGGDNVAPLPWQIPVGQHRIWVIAGADQELITVNLPVASPTPPVPPAPPTPVLTQIWAPSNIANRGDGTSNKSLSHTWIKGYEQNITLLDGKDYVLNDGISEQAWAEKPDDSFSGQGLYIHDKGGNVQVSNWYFGWNGWQVGRNPHAKNIFRHGCYINKNGSITFTRCIFDRNCSIGAKVMRDATFTDCLFMENSIGTQAIYGTGTFTRCTFYKGAYNWNGSNHAGNIGLDIYTRAVLQDTWFIGGPSSTMTMPLVNPYDGGVIKLNRSHKQYTDVTGGSLTCSGDCRIVGWSPEKGSGKFISGDNLKGADGKTWPGLVIRPGVVLFDQEPYITNMKSGKVSVGDTAILIRDAIRKIVV